MDFDSIPPGVRFADHIRSSMKQSDAVIAVIGPHWLELLQERAAKFEDDYVRIELALALEFNKPITPICVNSASVPARTSLPADLRPLLDYNIAFLDRTNFYERIERIIAAVEVVLDAAQLPKSEPASASDQLIAKFSPTQNELSAKEYYNRALARDRQDYEGKIADYSEAIHINPQFASAYYNRGNARKAKGDIKGAIVDYQKYLDLGGGTSDLGIESMKQHIRNLQAELELHDKLKSKKR